MWKPGEGKKDDAGAIKVGLSKSVLSMKFMKRKADEISVETDEKSRKTKVTN
jgi:hypothetical protein